MNHRNNEGISTCLLQEVQDVRGQQNLLGNAVDVHAGEEARLLPARERLGVMLDDGQLLLLRLVLPVRPRVCSGAGLVPRARGARRRGLGGRGLGHGRTVSATLRELGLRARGAESKRPGFADGVVLVVCSRRVLVPVCFGLVVNLRKKEPKMEQLIRTCRGIRRTNCLQFLVDSFCNFL